MVRLLLAYLFACSVWTLPQAAHAYKLNPCLRILTGTEKGPWQRPINPWNPCAAGPRRLQPAVHEHMTVASIREYRSEPIIKGVALNEERWALNYMTAPRWSVPDGKFHETNALLFGTWWNDDPLMHLWGGGSDFRSGIMHLDRLFSQQVRLTYEGGVKGCAVASDEHLGRASHFGALQHLHFMTSLDGNVSAKKRIAATATDALTWIEFAYSVAIGETKADQPLTAETQRLLKLPSVARNLCLSDPKNAKVRSLFTRQGPSTSTNIDFRNRITPDVALGSIFHVIQDSFSPAHTCRVPVEATDGSFKAALRDVYNYNLQNRKDHAVKDDFPDWLVELVRASKRRYSNDPVTLGAWLLGAVDSRLPWNDVRAHLESTIFMVEPDDDKSARRSCI